MKEMGIGKETVGVCLEARDLRKGSSNCFGKGLVPSLDPLPNDLVEQRS